jgi:hypothetical protein
MRGPGTLHAAVTGTADRVPPIVAACWEAIALRLRLAPPAAWTDADDLALEVARFLDCAPGLVDELLAAGIDTEALEARTHHDRHQVRRPARRDRDRAPRERNER